MTELFMCPTCKGTGEQVLKVAEVSIEGTAYEEVRMRCIICKSKGKVDQITLDLLDAMDDIWCRCGAPAGSTYHTVKDGTDYCSCNNCGKTTQVG